MSTDASSAVEGDILASARDRVAVTPIPDWVQPCGYARDFKPKSTGPVTHFLLDRQVHAERHATFFRTAVRLETMQAVQQHSQWRVEFSPDTDWVEVHSIKVLRSGSETEHAKLEKIQFLQREARLEGFVIDGGVTLLVLLEDVRSGDTLEWCYTIRGRSRLLPESCSEMFSIPDDVQLGKHHVFVRFAETRALKWKSSSPDFTPEERREGGEIFWTWLRENVRSDEREAGTPIWYVAYPWIQISDCADWQTVAVASHNAWKRDGATDGLEASIREIEDTETDAARKVQRAIQHVQDDYRYLSVNLEVGGQIPARCATVVQRRYGDCKDLAFLLSSLLQGMGIAARPVLVNAYLRKSIGNLLPSPNVFNHVIVEYELGGKKRWVDATCKAQGGDALNRSVPDFGLGLPITPDSTQLAKPPVAAIPSLYEIKEHFLVDTTGKSSSLAIVITTHGFEADILRLQFANEGVDAIAKRRLETCERRFPEVKRVENLQFRDDRENNEFVLSEVFEINGFLLVENPPAFCWIPIQNWALSGVLPVLSEAEPVRKMPLALPHPCKVVYKFEIESPGLDVTAIPPYKLRNEFFEVSLTGRALQKFTMASYTLTTFDDSVPAQKIAEYQKQIAKVLPAFALRLRLPTGYSSMRRRSDFGALPAPKRPIVRTGVSSSTRAPVPAAAPPPGEALIASQPLQQISVAPAAAENVAPEAVRPKRDKLTRKRFASGDSGRGLQKVELVVLILFALLVLAFGALMFFAVSYSLRHG